MTEEKIVATVIVHENYSDEVWQNAINTKESVLVKVIGQYSDQGETTTSLDIINDYVLKGDTRSSNAIIDFNNICIFRLDRNSSMVKIVRENEHNFSLKGSVLVDPYSDSIEKNDIKLRVVFWVVNLDLQTPNRFNEITFDIKINDPITQEIKDELASHAITLKGTDWTSFEIGGDCILNIHSEDPNTSFYGRKESGFIIKKEQV